MRAWRRKLSDMPIYCAVSRVVRSFCGSFWVMKPSPVSQLYRTVFDYSHKPDSRNSLTWRASSARKETSPPSEVSTFLTTQKVSNVTANQRFDVFARYVDKIV